MGFVLAPNLCTLPRGASPIMVGCTAARYVMTTRNSIQRAAAANLNMGTRPEAANHIHIDALQWKRRAQLSVSN